MGVLKNWCTNLEVVVHINPSFDEPIGGGGVNTSSNAYKEETFLAISVIKLCFLSSGPNKSCVPRGGLVVEWLADFTHLCCCALLESTQRRAPRQLVGLCLAENILMKWTIAPGQLFQEIFFFLRNKKSSATWRLNHKNPTVRFQTTQPHWNNSPVQFGAKQCPPRPALSVNCFYYYLFSS